LAAGEAASVTGRSTGAIPLEIRAGLWLPPVAWGLFVTGLLAAGALVFRSAVSGADLAPAPANLGLATRAALVAALSFGYTLAAGRVIAIAAAVDLQQLGALPADFDPREDEARVHLWAPHVLRRSRWAGLAGIALFVATVEGPSALLGAPPGSAWIEFHALSYLLVLGVLFFWVAGRTAYRAIASVGLPPGGIAVDVFDLRPLRVWGRMALRGSLAWVIGLSLGTLVFLNPELRFRESLVVFVPLLLVTLAISAGSLLLPLRPVHRALRAAKAAELERVSAALRGERGALAGSRVADRAGTLGLADLLAYRRWVEELPEWPFEGPASGRIALFVVIPVVSWTAAALVERVVSRLLG
jgi:hypothetical protein